MDSLANPAPGPPGEDDRHLRLENRVAELSTRVAQLERQIATLSSTAPAVTAPPAAPPPPPPRLQPVLSSPGAPPPSARPDLENRIGSQLFNRVGIVALLIGATWFLKLAIDNQWIGPLGRVLIGILSGAALILWSERFRRHRFVAFSYSLKAIGSGVLYLALWAAFQLYHLLPASVALAAMLVATAWNAYMAWAQNSELLAGYALAGGFATPLLLSTGGNHEIFLFNYLLAIDIASVALVRLKSWPRLAAFALPVTIGYFIGWYSRFFTPDQITPTILFTLAFFATFVAPSIYPPAIEPTAPPEPVTPPASTSRLDLIPQLALPLANAAFVSLALYSILQDSGYHDSIAWVMIALGALYLLLMRLPQPVVTAAIHLSLAVAFLTIAIPLKAHGRWITIGWLTEGVALLWIATRLSSAGILVQKLLRALSLVALALGFIGTLIHLGDQSSQHLPVFFSHTFATALYALAAFATAAWLSFHAPPDPGPHIRPSRSSMVAAAIVAFNIIAVLTGIVQIDALSIYSALPSDALLQRALAVSAFLMLYGAALLAVGFWRRSAFIRWQGLILLVFSILKTFLYDMRNLSQGYRVLSFIGLGVLLMAVSFAYQKDWLALRDSPSPQSPQEVHPE